MYWLRDQQPPCPWDMDAGKSCLVASLGDISLLEWLRNQGCRFNASVTAAAVTSQKIETFCWLRKQNPPCPWNWRVPSWALSRESDNWTPSQALGMALRHLFKAMEGAASEQAHAVIIGLLAELSPDQMARIEVINAVADSGRVAVMRQLLSWQPHAAPDLLTFVTAIAAGRLPMLQYLRSLDSSCPWDPQFCQVACRHDQLEVLQWLRDQGCPWTSACCLDSVKRMQRFQYPGRGPAQMLAWMRKGQFPCPWTPECCEASSCSGLLPLLRDPRKRPSQAWTREDCMRASRQKFRPLLAELGDNDWNALRSIASSKLIYELQRPDNQQYLEEYLRRTPHLCACIAARGQLDTLQWLFHWPKQQQYAALALEAAAKHNQLDVVQFLLSTGLKPRAQMNLDHVKLPCLTLLARAGFPMRMLHPHLVAELVEPWYVFMGLVRWAAYAVKDRNSSSASCNKGQAFVHDLLRGLAGLSSDLVLKIASEALFTPTEAKCIQ